ncbi:MAG TPA: tRNA lysidine(34) synthetase TilS [Candidatus Tumulicola sp.]
MRGAHPERNVELAVARDGVVRPGERVLIACSGGPDSVALAAVLRAAGKPLHLTLRVAHVNHAARASSAQDECVAAAVAGSLGLTFDVVRLRSGARDESGWRDARYAALIELARQTGCAAVATAHHAEDQSETVLLALFRGTGPDGIAGMRPRRTLAPEIDLVRPLLRVRASQLRRYCHLRGLPYAVDPSNADGTFARNAVRQALDALRPLFPGLDEAVARAAALAGDERAETGRAGLRRRVRGRLAEERELRDVDFLHIEAAVAALECGRSGSFYMKAGLRLEILRGEIAGITRA